MTPRSELKTVLLFGALMVTLGFPALSLRDVTSRALVACVAPVLSALRFGGGGRADLRSTPASPMRRAGEHVTSDAALTLHVEGMTGELVVAMSVRRDVYLPLLTFCAAIVSAPYSMRRRLIALSLGFPVAALASFGLLCLTVHWLFAHQLPQLYGLSDDGLVLLDGLVGTLLMPSSVRFALALLFAIACIGFSAWLCVRPSGVARLATTERDRRAA